MSFKKKTKKKPLFVAYPLQHSEIVFWSGTRSQMVPLEQGAETLKGLTQGPNSGGSAVQTLEALIFLIRTSSAEPPQPYITVYI